jgi:hypothetical protein
VSATLTPPFNWQWTRSRRSGPPGLVGDHVSADRNSGVMRWGLYNASSAWSEAEAVAALGVFFRPMVGPVNLRIASMPRFNTSNGASSVFGAALSEGWVGFVVYSHAVGGGPRVEHVVQRQIQWRHGTGWFDRRGTPFLRDQDAPLMAQLQAVRDRWYGIWVWCGGMMRAEGNRGFWGSFAHSSMFLTLPSISWTCP